MVVPPKGAAKLEAGTKRNGPRNPLPYRGIQEDRF
jgi:hypothetical protein